MKQIYSYKYPIQSIFSVLVRFLDCNYNPVKLISCHFYVAEIPFSVKPVEKTEKECQLEAELKKVEDEYKATREKVNELREVFYDELGRRLDIARITICKYYFQVFVTTFFRMNTHQVKL